MEFERLSRTDWTVGVGSSLLALDLLVLPWWSASFGFVSVSETGVGAPDSLLGVLSCLLALAIAAHVVLAKLTRVELPKLPISWPQARLAAAAAATGFLVLKFLLHLHPSYLSIGCWGGLVLAGVVLAGALRALRDPEEIASGA
ncbi:MAG: hypothetical protein ACYCS7_07975 [Acidimicrobiales bacterium]